MILAGTIGYYIGNKTTINTGEIDNIITNEISNSTDNNSINKTINDYGQTFYATIEKISGNNILVEGLKINDINYRDEYTFNVQENTILLWRGTIINISDLKEGQTISITCVGTIEETYPAIITNVVRIQLLNDEI